MKKLISLILVFVMMCVCCAFYTSASALNEDELLNNRPKYSITADYDDNELLLVLTREASKLNPVFTPEDFEGLGVVEIRRMTRDGESYHIYHLTLDRHDKQNVLDVIEELHKNMDILVAEPNYRLYGEFDDPQPTTAEEFISYVVSESEMPITEKDVTIEYMYTFSQDKYFVRYYYGLDYNQVEIVEKIGAYELWLPSPPMPVVYANGRIYDLKEAYETGILTDVDLETMMCFRKVDIVKLLIGDVDEDGEVSVLDATLIQQFVASIVNNSGLCEKLADLDDDGYISILDATAIQLNVAKLV